MSRSLFLRRVGALVTAATISVGLAVAPASAATTNVVIPMSCRGTPTGVPVGGKDFHASGIKAEVTAPDTLEVGQEGQVSFLIKPIHIRMPKLPLGAKFVDASRMKVDFRIPDGLKFVSANVDHSGSPLKGFTAKVVNEAGNPDPAGRILRLVGQDDATVGHSPNVSVNSAGGIIVPVDATEMTIAFPRVTLTFEATQVGDQTFGVNAQGPAANYNADENFFSILVHVNAPIVGDIWASARCTPRKSEDSPITLQTTRVATIKVVQPTAEAPATTTTGDPAPAEETETTEETPTPDAELTTPPVLAPIPSDLVGKLAMMSNFIVANPGYITLLTVLR